MTATAGLGHRSQPQRTLPPPPPLLLLLLA